MILIRNRSMQIPREEQTIGVVGDGMTASRVFRIARREANENDLSSLSFRLDIEYQDGTKNVAMAAEEPGRRVFRPALDGDGQRLKKRKDPVCPDPGAPTSRGRCGGTA